MTPGYATPAGTARYAQRFPQFRDFFRNVQGLAASSLGLGTYLGQPDEATDAAYTDAARFALANGVNLLDAAINYRHQRSERSLAPAIASLPRDEVVVCTKAGFLTPGAVPENLDAAEVAGRMHCMAPAYLADQIARSRANLGVATLDVFYLHNPETQLRFVDAATFHSRMRAAFETLERQAADGAIQWYGTATWDGYRKTGQLDLAKLEAIAREVGGANHRFRFIQLPFNLAMIEARSLGVLRTAADLGITVVASASLLQTRLLDQMPEAMEAMLPGLDTNAQRALQFTRSAPGIAVALAGMSQAAHVAENLGVAQVAPLTETQFNRFFE